MATEQRSVIVRYRADASGFNKALRNIDRNTARAARSLGNLDKQVLSLRNGFRLLSQGVAAYYAALQAGRVVSLVSQIERLDVALSAASGSVQDFSRNLAFVRRTADEYGISQNLLIDQFTRFVVAGNAVGLTFDQVSTQFEALATTAAAFQLSGAAIEGIVLGWQQSMGSATINMEDLRQVADRIPGGLALATQAFREMTGRMDVTTKQFKEFVAEGEVGVEFLDEYARVLNESFGPLAAQGAQTLTAEVNRFKNELSEIGRALVEAGVLEWLTDVLRGFRDLITDIRQLTGQLPTLEEALEIDEATASTQELYDATRVLNNEQRGLTSAMQELGEYVRKDWLNLRYFGQAPKIAEQYRQELEKIEQKQKELNAATTSQTTTTPGRTPVAGSASAQDLSESEKSVEKLANRFGDLALRIQAVTAQEELLAKNQVALTAGRRDAVRVLDTQIEQLEDALRYQRDYNRALDRVKDPLKEATFAQKAYADAAAVTAQRERELQRNQERRVDSLRTLAEVQNRLDRLAQPVQKEVRTPQEKRFREVFSDDTTLGNVALKTAELGRTISGLPVDQAADKVSDFVGQLEKLRETATSRWDQLAVEDALRRVRDFATELAEVSPASTIGAERGIMEFAGGAAIPEVTPELDITFSDESIQLGLAAIEAASQADPIQLAVDLKANVQVDASLEEEETIGGQREES